MEKDDRLTVKKAVHRLQFSLIEGIKHENQLYAAGSLISQSDYEDVVTEREIAGMCGYPLCSNPLPSERPWKGHYRISLKEHKVYDLQETCKYCSSVCLINSRTFSGSLPGERSPNLNPAKLTELLKQFEELNLGQSINMGKNGDLGLSDLKIQEKLDTEPGKVSFEEWTGPSNAIDGYVPKRDRILKTQSNGLQKEEGQKQVESKPVHAGRNMADIISDDVNFTSFIITQDEYSISKTADSVKVKDSKGKVGSKNLNNASSSRPKPAASLRKIGGKRSVPDRNVIAADDKLKASNYPLDPIQNDLITVATVPDDKLCMGKESTCGATVLKSSLKTSDSKKVSHSVTWADERADNVTQNLCEFSEAKDGRRAAEISHSSDSKGGEDSDMYASAEACARALSQAAEAVASGKSDVPDAVLEAGLVILPPPTGVNELQYQENGDAVETDTAILKWPLKEEFSDADLFDSEDSWFDRPPEEFNLTLSPFSTMFMALFAWISSSSLAYVYGREDSFHEDYLFVNGREYPRKIVSPDGRSSEIKQTLAGCLARALPGLVAEHRLPIPVSTLEQGMGLLLDTMSFVDPLPAFRMKQWQVIVLLFLDALSISRIPALSKYMDRRILLPKVLEGAQMSAEEFEILKDLIIPLGRVPQFSSQSGG